MGNGCARLPSTERSNCTAQLTGAQHNIQFIHIKCSNADLKKKKVSNKHVPAAEVCS